MRMILVISSLVAFSAHARMKPVIYGQDNRVETFQSKSEIFKTLANSTAAMITKKNITIRGETAEITGPTLGELFQLCPSERFHQQPSAATCSGFLVAPDIMATAGHCIQGPETCEQFSWVFDYKLDHENQTTVSLPSTEVYSCKNVIMRVHASILVDFALVKLDRPVTGHQPVKLSQTIPSEGTPLVVIGHPSGLPQKIADEARITSIHADGFMSNLDTFGINSGSAVFNAKTGEVLGILVTGQLDYVKNRELACMQANVVPNDEGGEGVSSVSQFVRFLPR